MDNILEMRNISKIYSNGVYANKNVNFSLREGEIHALVGENGAGKTTLMKVLFGIEPLDEGEILMYGKPVAFHSPDDAIKHGICMVHQHFMLVPSLTVAENTALGSETTKGVFIDKEYIRKRVLDLSKQYNLGLNPDDVVEDISVGMKQRVEILKTLYREAKIIILDEPTAVLTPQETEELFHQLTLLKEKGHTIIFISHKLREVKQITDRISVLRKGEMITTINTKDVDEKAISDLIIGESVNLTIDKAPAQPKEVVLDVNGLNARDNHGNPLFIDLEMKLRAGEILGLASIEGNGQQQLIDILTSMRRFDSGNIAFEGKPVRFDHIADSRKTGLGYIPSDRMVQGAAQEMSIEDNLISNRMGDKSLYNGIFLSPKKISALSERLVKEYSIKANSAKTAVTMLSGGNIQKVVAAREFSTDVKLVIADQPTRGIDVLSADFIHKTIVQLRDDGVAILLVSADLDELLKVSDSLIVMYDGAITAYFPDASVVTQMELGTYMLGTNRMDPAKIRSDFYEG